MPFASHGVEHQRLIPKVTQDASGQPVVGASGGGGGEVQRLLVVEHHNLLVNPGHLREREILQSCGGHAVVT